MMLPLASQQSQSKLHPWSTGRQPAAISRRQLLLDGVVRELRVTVTVSDPYSMALQGCLLHLELHDLLQDAHLPFSYALTRLLIVADPSPVG